MTMVWSPQFGLRDIGGLPPVNQIPIGTFVQAEGTGEWKRRVEGLINGRSAYRYQEHLWVAVPSEDLPAELKTELLLRGIPV